MYAFVMAIGVMLLFALPSVFFPVIAWLTVFPAFTLGAGWAGLEMGGVLWAVIYGAIGGFIGLAFVGGMYSIREQMRREGWFSLRQRAPE